MQTPLETAPVQDAAKPYTAYYNAKYDIVSMVAFLVGVEKRHFENEHEPPKMEIYEKFERVKGARIVRNLCRVRTALEQHYSQIRAAFYYDIKNLATLPEYIPTDAIESLLADGITLQKSHPDVITYVLNINRELSNRVGMCEELFPEWINWSYIRALLIMPNGLKTDGVKAAGMEYAKNKNRYPYQCYLNWTGRWEGNILYSDKKFVELLYESHEDRFSDYSLVKDVGDEVKDNIADFIAGSGQTIIVVDCENSDPIRLAAALSSLSKSSLDKIRKILLFDSEYTTTGWQILSGSDGSRKKASPARWNVLSTVASFPMERIVVPRLNERKSQVDMTLATATCKEVYQNNVDSVILVSSDSDYWALIQSLSDIHFLVMVEKSKCGGSMKQALQERGIHYCYLDDFYTGASYALKTMALQQYLQDFLDETLHFNAVELLDEAVQNTWVQMTEKERSAFYDRYLRKLRAVVSAEGDVTLELGQ